MEIRENIIAILVNNKPDVLARISGTLSGRGFNIESISANVTKDPTKTKIIITTLSSKATLSKILKQIEKLVDITKVEDLTGRKSVRRELFLVRLNWEPEGRKEKIAALVEKKKWKLLCANDNYCVLEITGESDALLAEVMSLEELGLEDFTRTGVIALEK